MRRVLIIIIIISVLKHYSILVTGKIIKNTIKFDAFKMFKNA
jgi:hypothetical protein